MRNSSYNHYTKRVEVSYYEKIGDTVTCIDEELPFKLPEGWSWCRLGCVFNVNMGQSPKGNTILISNDGVEFHQGKIWFGQKYLKQSNQKTIIPTKLAPPQSVILSVRAPVGKVNITEKEICIGRGLCAIIPTDKITSDFVFYWLTAMENDFIAQATGTTFSAITGDIVKNQLIPLPPLHEQNRIVHIVSNAFDIMNNVEKKLS